MASDPLPDTLPPDMRLGHVHLRVPDLDRSLAFYRDLLGFRLAGEEQGDLALSASGEPPYQFLLQADAAASRRPPGTTGLYHVAIRFPARQALARVLAHLLEQGWPLQGAADHGVSEALYLADPDRNGIELYVDRPRSTWPYAQGQVAMTTEPLDVEGLLAEAAMSRRRAPWHIDPAADLGHIHLQVSDLDRAERFYTALGLQVTQRGFPGALFLSAAGYHHHVGLNVWTTRGAPPPPAGARGLLSFSLSLPNGETLQCAVDRLQRIEVLPARSIGYDLVRGVLVYDPDGIGIELLTLRNT